jgi:uncharacterized protein YjbI with pentapeptide repeats
MTPPTPPGEPDPPATDGNAAERADTPATRDGRAVPTRSVSDRFWGLTGAAGAWAVAHPLRCIAALAAVVTVAAAYPLALEALRRVAALPAAGRVLLSGAGLSVLIGVAAVSLRERTAQARLGTLIAAAWAAVIVLVAVLAAGAWWVTGAPAWQPIDSLTPRHLDAIATRAFAIVAGLGGAALLVIHYRRQRTTEAENVRAELAVQREDTKLFTDRFTAATAQLGDAEPAIRLAGVHALAHLADDAPSDELLQMVIDVLCGHLRMPYTPAPALWAGDLTEEQREERTAEGAAFYPMDVDAPPEQIAAYRAEQLAFAGLREVRHTIVRIIGDHLREDTRWRGKNYDFTGARFDGGNMSRAHFTGGAVSFLLAEFAGGTVNFRRAAFTGGEVDFRQATFSGGVVDFSDAEFSGGEVVFSEAKFSGGTVNFRRAAFSGGEVDFSEAKFSGGTVNFRMAAFSGGEVHFGWAEFSGGRVSFMWARFSGGTVYFSKAKFFGDSVDFYKAAFSGGTVEFSGEFEDAEGACPIFLLEAVAAGTPGVVTLPEAWLTEDNDTPDS